MILVRKDGSKISISGHALYDDYGKDIVCSSTSSIVITTINAILLINDKAISYHQDKDELLLEIKSFDDITMKLIDNMLSLLKELSSQYPKNIQIKEGV